MDAGGSANSSLLRRFLDHLYLERNLSGNTLRSYRSDLNLFFAFLEAGARGSAGDSTAAAALAADRDALEEYLSFCRKTGLSHRTISRYLSSMKAFYKFLVDEKVADRDPTVGVGSPKIVRNPPEYLTLEEVERLLGMPDEGTPLGLRDSAVIELMYSAGLRVSEVAGLETSDVDIARRGLRVFGKGKKERAVPFGEKAATLLERYAVWAREEILRGRIRESFFVNFRGDPLGRKGIWKMIKSYARASGIGKNIKPHTLRHSFGAHLIQNGADLRVVQELLGHADISTTQIYTHLDRGTLIDIHRKCHPLGSFDMHRGPAGAKRRERPGGEE